MSRQATGDLMTRLKTDEAFRDALLAEPDVAARLELARAEGYACTEADVAALGAELEEAALADVVGGILDPAGCVQPWRGLADF